MQQGPGAAPPVEDIDPGESLRHSKLEDLQAMLIATLLIALGVVLYRHVGLLTGGTAGLGFLLHYLGGWPFGVSYFILNLPFYALALRVMGKGFTLRTLMAVALLSAMSDMLPHHLILGSVAPWLAAVLGGILMGNGFLILFRHRASLGGLGIVALMLQNRRGWRAGYVQMVFDVIIIGTATLYMPLDRIGWSVLGMVVLNLVIATNHRPGRYVAQ